MLIQSYNCLDMTLHGKVFLVPRWIDGPLDPMSCLKITAVEVLQPGEKSKPLVLKDELGTEDVTVTNGGTTIKYSTDFNDTMLPANTDDTFTLFMEVRLGWCKETDVMGDKSAIFWNSTGRDIFTVKQQSSRRIKIYKDVVVHRDNGPTSKSTFH